VGARQPEDDADEEALAVEAWVSEGFQGDEAWDWDAEEAARQDYLTKRAELPPAAGEPEAKAVVGWEADEVGQMLQGRKDLMWRKLDQAWVLAGRLQAQGGDATDLVHAARQIARLPSPRLQPQQEGDAVSDGTLALTGTKRRRAVQGSGRRVCRHCGERPSYNGVAGSHSIARILRESGLTARWCIVCLETEKPAVYTAIRERQREAKEALKVANGVTAPSSNSIGVVWQAKMKKWQARCLSQDTGKVLAIGYGEDPAAVARLYDQEARFHGRPLNFPAEVEVVPPQDPCPLCGETLATWPDHADHFRTRPACAAKRREGQKARLAEGESGFRGDDRRGHTPKEEWKWVCSTCEEKFPSRVALREHRRVAAHGVRPARDSSEGRGQQAIVPAASRKRRASRAPPRSYTPSPCTSDEEDAADEDYEEYHQARSIRPDRDSGEGGPATETSSDENSSSDGEGTQDAQVSQELSD